MANQWILYLNEAPDKQEWLLLSETGEVLGGPRQGTLQQVAEDIKDESFTVVVPSAQVTILTEVVPARQRQKVIKVLPYAMEEQVAGDVEELHFALGEKSQDGSYLVAIVAHSVMQAWMNQLTSAKLEPLTMVPDNLALPYEKNDWVIAVNPAENVCLIRTGDSSAFTVDSDNLLTYLKLELSAYEASKKPEKILVWGARSDFFLQIQSAFAPIAVEALNAPNTLIELLAKGVDKPFVNLVQQQYEKKASFTEIAHYLKPVGAVIALWLVVLLGYNFLYYQKISRIDETFYNQIVGLYRVTFPEEKNVVNPRKQMDSNLQKLRMSGQKTSFLQLLGVASSRLQSDSSIRLLGVRYGRAKAELEIELETKDYQAFEQIRQNLADLMEVEVRTSNISEDNIVQGSLLLKRKA